MGLLTEAKDNLRLLLTLPSPTKSKGYKHEPLHLVHVAQGFMQPNFLSTFCEEAEARGSGELPRCKAEQRNWHDCEEIPAHRCKTYLFGMNIIFKLETSRKQQVQKLSVPHSCLPKGSI